ncbi:FPP/GGPP synthase family protein [Aspergillus ruber CBS 135680]|uniref:Terpenoid synthase n=1 Tax=Aspergillus ruber (strain CBS 135680) TaxID=1388766 RepID=A0A017SNV5_ASPRC|nr:terpenoid synthase [Aspergillus ruber CBS 135680]EYE98617.1 terpenoid synthase [Aspergillus ruber CBS 135680]
MAALETFAATRSELFAELQEDLEQRGNPSCLTATTEGGKLNRGITVVKSGYALLPNPPTPQEHAHLRILGWLVELFQAAYLVWDDIMDGSEYRRGRPCWYKGEGVGLTAINDACMLKSCIFMLLRRHFRGHPEYAALVELFHEAAFRTELGQLCDTTTAASGQIQDMTAERYEFIARNKTAFYSFYLPVALAMLYCGRTSEEGLGQAKSVLLDIGVYFQIQDDFLDVFGDPAVTGKVGTDIQDSKCTWLVVQARGLSDVHQQQALRESYGQKGMDHERRVKGIFSELGIDALYTDFEKRRLGELQAQIDALDESRGGVKKAVLNMILDSIQQRDK